MGKKLPLLAAMSMRQCQQAFWPQLETGLDTTRVVEKKQIENRNGTQQQQEMVQQNFNACAILITAFMKNASLMSIIQQINTSMNKMTEKAENTGRDYYQIFLCKSKMFHRFCLTGFKL